MDSIRALVNALSVTVTFSGASACDFDFAGVVGNWTSDSFAQFPLRFHVQRSACPLLKFNSGFVLRAADVFQGRTPSEPPRLGEIAEIMREHAGRLSDWIGEAAALRSFRRHATWYTKGFRGSAELRERVMRLETLSELDEVLKAIDPTAPFPRHSLRVPRGKSSGTQSVSLPQGYLDQRDDATPPGADAEDEFSGG